MLATLEGDYKRPGCRRRRRRRLQNSSMRMGASFGRCARYNAVRQVLSNAPRPGPRQQIINLLRNQSIYIYTIKLELERVYAGRQSRKGYINRRRARGFI